MAEILKGDAEAMHAALNRPGSSLTHSSLERIVERMYEAAARIAHLEGIVERVSNAAAAMHKSNPFPWHAAMAAADCEKPGYDDTCSIEDANGVCVVNQIDDEYAQLLLNLAEAAAESARNTAKESTR